MIPLPWYLLGSFDRHIILLSYSHWSCLLWQLLGPFYFDNCWVSFTLTTPWSLLLWQLLSYSHWSHLLLQMLAPFYLDINFAFVTLTIAWSLYHDICLAHVIVISFYSAIHICPVYSNNCWVPFTLITAGSLLLWQLLGPFYSDNYSAIHIGPFYSDNCMVPFTLTITWSFLLWELFGHFYWQPLDLFYHPDSQNVKFTLPASCLVPLPCLLW